FLQLSNSRRLRFRQAPARHPDLLGHRRDLLPRYAHHRRSRLGQFQPALAALYRRVRDARAAVCRRRPHLHPVRQGDRHLPRQRAHVRPAAADVAFLCGGMDRRRVRRAADRHPHLSADLPSRGDGARLSDQARGISTTIMSSDLVAITGFVALFAMMLLRVPIGMAMGLVGVTGFGYIVGAGPALKMVGQTSMRTVTDYTFGVIPMFLLMGAFVANSGMSRELFRAANSFLGHLRGGLGIATIAACGGFAAISGSSVATAATFSAVAYPEMRRFGYPQSFSAGVIAVGGTLGAMLPPSTVLVVYGIITQQDIGKLFIAGIVPGLLAIMMHMITIGIIGVARPGFLPAGPRASWRDRLAALRDVWSPLLLFLFVIGGLYGGFFIPTEAGAVGAVGAFIIGILRGKLTRDGILQSLLQATRTAAA